MSFKGISKGLIWSFWGTSLGGTLTFYLAIWQNDWANENLIIIGLLPLFCSMVGAILGYKSEKNPGGYQGKTWEEVIRDRNPTGMPVIPDDFIRWDGMTSEPPVKGPVVVLTRDGEQFLDEHGLMNGWLWIEHGATLFYSRDEIVAYRPAK